jgi:hypothetical protein
MPKRHNAKNLDGRTRQAIITRLAHGESHQGIARALRVSKNTVIFIHNTEWNEVERRKGRIAAQAERAATQAFDRINAKLDSSDDIPLNVLVPVAGMSVDKMVLLRDGPAYTVSVQHHVDLTEDDIIAFAVARSKQLKQLSEKRAQAAVVEVPALPAETHLRAEKRPRKKKAD